MSTELVERLRAMAAQTRECIVCDGDGIKANGRECGGCNGSGRVPVRWGASNQAAREAAAELTALTAKVALLTEALDELGSAIDGTTFPANHPIWNARRAARRALSEPDKEGT